MGPNVYEMNCDTSDGIEGLRGCLIRALDPLPDVVENFCDVLLGELSSRQLASASSDNCRGAMRSPTRSVSGVG
jgi:hypothetical protein